MTRLLFVAALISTLIACQSPVDSGASAAADRAGSRQVVIRATMLMMKMVDPARLDDFSIVEVIGEPADIEQSAAPHTATLRGIAARVIPASQVERAVRAMDETVDLYVMGNPEVIVPIGESKDVHVYPAQRVSTGAAQPRSPIEPWILRVRPTSNDRGAPIRLKLTPAIDLNRFKEMGELAAGVPVPQSHDMTVLVKPGQTIVVAGLFPVLEVTSSYDRKTHQPDASKSAPAEVVAIISVSELPIGPTVAAK